MLAISFSACGDDALPEGLVIPGTSSEVSLSSGASVSSAQSGSVTSTGSLSSGAVTSSSGTVSSGGAVSSVSTGTSLPTGVTFVETFDNATTAMYASGTTSANAKGIVWSWGNGRTDLTLNGKALCGPKNDASTDLTATLPAGVGSIGFKFKYGYDAGTIGVKINGTLVATSPAATSSEQIFSVTVNSMGSTVVALVINKRVIIDDITWTDGTPPETDKPTVSIDLPTASQTVTGYTATFSGTAADPGTGASGVKEVWVKVDGGTAVKASGTTSWTYTPASLTAGAHSIEVYAVDNAGNTSLSATRSFTVSYPVDTTRPTCTITTPTSSTISGTASDDYTVKEVKVSMDGTTWYTATGTTSWSYTFGGMTSGNTYTVYAKAIDMAGNETSPVVQATFTLTLPKWTVMVYLCADNDLEAAGLNDFNEMEKGIADAIAAGNGAIVDNLNVIVLIDRAAKTGTGYSSAVTESGGSDWTDTRLYRIKPDTSTSYFGSERLDDGGAGAGHIANLGEKKMDDPATLSWFIGYNKANFPAQNYALILWNHGGGSRGSYRTAQTIKRTKEVCWDDASGSWEPLYIAEIQQAVGNHFSSGNKLGVSGFDACLMGMVETAYESRNLASYMVGSMQSEQGDGWDYTDWLSSIGDASGLTPNQLAKVWVESYERFIEGSAGSGSGETLAATDLSAMETLKTRIDALAVAIYGENKKTAIESVRDASVNYIDGQPEYCPFFDLYDFCNRLYNDTTNGFTAGLKSAAQAVIDQLGVAIIRCYGESGNGQSYYFAEDAAAKRGLSIFFTTSSTDWNNQGWYTTADNSLASATGTLIYGNMDFPTASGSGVNTWRDLMDAWY